jgi:NADPH:quinone reductase-like Zn-dependent oxidoreductase
VTFVTAWYGLIEYAALRENETVAVIGSTGGVGNAVVQFAKRIGARVFAIDLPRASGDVQPAIVADVLLDSRDPNLPSTLRSLNHGLGADVVFNAAGGKMFGAGVKLLGHRGRQVEITAPAERHVSLDLVDFYHNESQLFGVDSLKRDLTAASRILQKLLPGFEDGSYRPPVIAKTLPLDDARHAYELVERGARGRVVLKPSHQERTANSHPLEHTFDDYPGSAIPKNNSPTKSWR